MAFDSCGGVWWLAAHKGGSEFWPCGEETGINGGASGGKCGGEAAGMVESNAVSKGGGRIDGVAGVVCEGRKLLCGS